MSYINRESAIQEVKELSSNPACEWDTWGVIALLERQPKAWVRPFTKAKWEWELADNGWADHICSNCGWRKNTDVHVSIGYKYCPNCGAMMKGTQ